MKKTVSLLIALLILVSSYYGIKELKWLSSTWNNPGNRLAPHENLTGIFEEEDFTMYQYVDWNDEKGINSWLLRD